MQTIWKKFLWRHGLFTYARDSLIFFMNLYLWSQVKDLQVIALFNIIYLVAHTSMFFVCMPMLKAGKSRSLMRFGLGGFALILAAVSIARQNVVDFAYLVALASGISNGSYWFVNHLEGIDLSNNGNRTSFLSFRNVSQGIAKLSVPGVGWIVFTLFSNDTIAYSIIFGTAMAVMVVAWMLTDIPDRVEEDSSFKESLVEFRKTKLFKTGMFNGFLYGLTLRSALPTVLLPFLIFQVVEKESSLSIIQTIIEIMALIATYYFAMHKKNTDYITKLFWLGASAGVVGLAALFVSLNFTTYVIFVVTYILSLGATSIASGTMSNNFVTTIADYKKHRIEFIVIREVYAISGFIAGYVFLYFKDDLSVASLRPIVTATCLGTIVSLIISLKLWNHVQRNEPKQ